jgi:hypothetical protein
LLKFDLDLDKFLEQTKTFNEPSLKDPLEECFAQFGCDLDLDKFLEQAETLMSQVWRILLKSALLNLNLIWILI